MERFGDLLTLVFRIKDRAIQKYIYLFVITIARHWKLKSDRLLDLGQGESVLAALGDIDRQICTNCGPHYSLWNDPKFELEEFRSAMNGVGATYSPRDLETPEDDFDLILIKE